MWVDAYAQQAAAKLDVLWVVDDSGSMESRQANLARNFHAFIDVFAKSATDFRIAITTTDILDNQGRLRGTPAILTPATVLPRGVHRSPSRSSLHADPVGPRRPGRERGVEVDHLKRRIHR